MAKSEKKMSFDVGKIGFRRCASVLQTQVPKLCTALDLSLLYILILGTYSTFARKNNFLALGVYCPAAPLERRPQVCRVKITCTKLPTNRFVSTTKISMKYVVNWIPLRIRVRSRYTQPHLNVSYSSCWGYSLINTSKLKKKTNSKTSCTWRKVVDGYKRNIVSLPKHNIQISRVFTTLMRPIVRNTQCDPLGFTN